MTGIVERLAAALVTGFARAVTGVRGDWRDAPPGPGPHIYFANHASHGDFVLVWTVLPLFGALPIWLHIHHFIISAAYN